MNDFKKKQWRAGGTDENGAPIGDLIADTFTKISQYSSILEPLTQATPLVPPVVWGAFSMFMKVRSYIHTQAPPSTVSLPLFPPTLHQSPSCLLYTLFHSLLSQYNFLLLAQPDINSGLKDGYG